MHAGRLDDAETCDRFLHDALTFLVGELFERFVLEARHVVTFIVIAHPALERGVAARSGVFERCAIRVRRQLRLAEGERVHPPATGGMNTTVSPCLSGVRQSLNSALSATFNCAAAS